MTMAAALTLLWPGLEAQAACNPSANGAGPNNTTVICMGTVQDQNAPNGYGTGQQNGNTLTVQSGASVTGTTGAGFFLGGNNTINNSGAIAGQGGAGVDASTVPSTSVTVNNLTATSSITGLGVAIEADSATGTATVTNAGTITATGVTNVGILAAVTNVTNSGTISTTATLANSFAIVGNTSVTVMNSGSISATGSLTAGPTNAIAGGIVNVTNTSTGTITAFGNQAFAIQANGVATIVNSGTISGGTTDITGNNNGGIFTLSSATVTNSGTISGNGLNSFGIFASGNLTLSNTGAISSTGNAFDGVFVGGTANITNSQTGRISTTGDGAFAIQGSNGGTMNLTNAGIVSATGPGSQGINAFALNINNSGSVTASGAGSIGIRARTGPIVNSGTISGEIGIQTSANGIVGTQPGLTVTNSGTIIGTAGTAIDFTSPRLDTLTIAPTSVIMGNVLAGAGDTFQLGGTGSGTFDLTLIGAAQQYRGFTTFNKIDSSTWTVTGTGNEAWTVQSGNLLVNGTINGTVNVTGGLLGGTGTVGSTTIANGATLSPGTNGIGTLTVNGSLTLNSAALYLFGVASTSGRTTVTGSAAVAGTAQAVFQATGLFQSQYTILSATGGRTGTFGNFVVTNLPSFITASLVYTPTEVDLKLTSGLSQIAGLTANQAAVAAGLDRALNSGGGFFAGLAGLAPSQIPAALNALSGEGTSGTQETAFGAGDLFLATMMDQGAFWRSGETGEPARGEFASMSYAAEKAEHPAFKAMPFKAPVYQPRWRTWAAGFDGTWRLNGEADPGSANLTHSTAGGAAGLDYQINPNLLLGFAAGGSASNFSVPDRATSGTVDGAHLGAYGVARSGAWYASGALAFATFDNRTNRTIAGVGPTEMENGKFNSDLFNGRFELGFKQAYNGFAFTPFAAVQFAELWQSGYSETTAAVTGAPGVLGLSYGSRSVSSLPTFVGAQFDSKLALANGMTWTPYARVSWVHEFEPTRQITASFIALPGSTFTVDGPRAARDAARVDLGSKLAITRNTSLFGSFNGEFSDRSHMYAGKGGWRVVW
jgi:outer membrane autotransporter protein